MKKTLPEPADFVCILGRYYRHVKTEIGVVLSAFSYTRLRDIFPRRQDRLKIPDLIGFTSEPDHLNFRQIVDGKWWNAYHELMVKPAPGEWPTIRKFLAHIFGEQFEYGMDYIELLYISPTQKLPALLLLSEENRTGKTTFVNLLTAIFGKNAVVLANEDINSRYNAHYATGLIAAIDEASIQCRADIDKIKSLITSESLMVEPKGFDRFPITNNLHVLFCSNDTHAALLIDRHDRRHWVRDVPVPPDRDPELLVKMIEEIPAFLNFLVNRPLSIQNEDRLYFKPERLATDALRRIIANTEARLHGNEMDLAEVINTAMDSIDKDELSLTLGDLLLLAQQSGFKNLSQQTVRRTLTLWFPDGPTNTSYQSYVDKEGQILATPVTRKGRFYKFNKQFINSAL